MQVVCSMLIKQSLENRRWILSPDHGVYQLSWHVRSRQQNEHVDPANVEIPSTLLTVSCSEVPFVSQGILHRASAPGRY